MDLSREDQIRLGKKTGILKELPMKRRKAVLFHKGGSFPSRNKHVQCHEIPANTLKAK